MDIIFLVGYAGSGKSYLSDKYRKKGYSIISTDQVIRDYLMENPAETYHFLIYNEEKLADVLESKNKFIKVIKKLIKQHKKVVIEGQLYAQLIHEIVGKNKNYQVVLVKPKNKQVWLKHIENRFKKNPANYGFIGILRVLDEVNDKKGLNDYIKNGSNSKLFRQLLNKAVIAKYHKHQDLLNYYKKHFDNLIVYLT